MLQRQYAQDDVVRVVVKSVQQSRKGAQGRRVIMRAGMGQERKVAPSRFCQGLRGRHAALTHRLLLEDTTVTTTAPSLRYQPTQRLRITGELHAYALQ